MEGFVTDIQRFAIHDGPGIRTLVFLKGCPLSCPWCCNPETQRGEPEVLFYDFKCIRCGKCLAVCPESAIDMADERRVKRDACTVCGACVEACPSGALKIGGDRMTVDEVYAVVEKDRIFYEKSGGGVTFSGGEPLAQLEFLVAALDKMRREGIHTAVETSGFAPWTALERVRGKVDLFLYDLKIMDPARHEEVVGVCNSVILGNLKQLAAGGSRVSVRVPVVPELTQNGDNIARIAEFVASLGTVRTLHLLPYHSYGKGKYRAVGRAYELESLAPPEKEQVARYAEEVKRLGLECIVGG